MNQILVNEKIYSTPELKRKKKFYKFEFFFSVFLLCLLTSFYIYAEYDRNKSEAVSQKILENMQLQEQEIVDTTTISQKENDIITVVLNRSAEEQEEVIEEPPQPAKTVTYTENGVDYTTVARIVIPKIGVDYPVFQTTDERIEKDLKVAPCKFWGGDPNEVGNFCIVGHNYWDDRFFSQVPTLENGDIIQLTDMSNRTLNYVVYDKHNVNPKDVSDTTQVTNGRNEITLITCTKDSKERVIVKATEQI